MGSQRILDRKKAIEIATEKIMKMNHDAAMPQSRVEPLFSGEPQQLHHARAFPV